MVKCQPKSRTQEQAAPSMPPSCVPHPSKKQEAVPKTAQGENISPQAGLCLLDFLRKVLHVHRFSGTLPLHPENLRGWRGNHQEKESKGPNTTLLVIFQRLGTLTNAPSPSSADALKKLAYQFCQAGRRAPLHFGSGDFGLAPACPSQTIDLACTRAIKLTFKTNSPAPFRITHAFSVAGVGARKG